MVDRCRLRRILALLRAQGARLALPGEFTQRAFLHGRIDLTQAEAVLDTIRARTDAGLRAAQRHLRGEMGKRWARCAGDSSCLLSSLEAALDYAEEGFDAALPRGDRGGNQRHSRRGTRVARLPTRRQAICAKGRAPRLSAGRIPANRVY